MRCLFCKCDTTSSKSVEHIVPESLWNTQHILPRGVVCDTCNNYFACEVEKPFLDSPAISRLRFHESIPNKRGNIPSTGALLLPDFPIVAHRHTGGPYRLSIDVPPEAFQHIQNQIKGTIIIPACGEAPPAHVVSRFLAKMALEAMALRLLPYAGGHHFLIDEPQLDALRNFARRGQPKFWPHHLRRIYEPQRMLTDPDGTSYQTVHEFDFLITADSEWYFVFVLFGLELTINMGGPEIDGYLAWLRDHDDASPLYSGESL